MQAHAYFFMALIKIVYRGTSKKSWGNHKQLKLKLKSNILGLHLIYNWIWNWNRPHIMGIAKKNTAS